MQAVVLAHQGGWDEALFVLGPIAVFTALLFVAKRRADVEAAEAEHRAGPPPPPPPR